VYSRAGRLLESDRTLAGGRWSPSDSVLPSFPEGPRTGRSFAFVYPDERDADALVHHGPSLRGLRDVTLGEADLHEARLVALPSAALRPHSPGRWIVPAPALDACLQACSAIARARLGLFALPVGFGRVWIAGEPAAGEECRAVVRLRGREEESIHFDFWLLAGDGRVALAVAGYRARTLASLEGGARPSLTAPAAAVIEGGA
jgi:Polyketide synthase dehydratase